MPADREVCQLSRGRYAPSTANLTVPSPEFFGGCEVRESGIQLARPEKALLDVLYLANTRSRLFARLPELELPPRFNVRDARRWIARISSPYRRTMVTRRLNAILNFPARSAKSLPPPR